MLDLVIHTTEEEWDEVKQEFISSKEQKLQLEHSLLSVAKWESKWCKPFLTDKEKSAEEDLDYVKCMTLTPNVDPSLYDKLSSRNVLEVNEYINRPMTATTIRDLDRGKGGSRGEQLTAELIYFYMISFNIPFECQKWHLNRLLTLIKVCDIKNRPAKKMSKKDIYRQNSALNASRRANLGTNG